MKKLVVMSGLLTCLLAETTQASHVWEKPVPAFAHSGAVNPIFIKPVESVNAEVGSVLIAGAQGDGNLSIGFAKSRNNGLSWSAHSLQPTWGIPAQEPFIDVDYSLLGATANYVTVFEAFKNNKNSVFYATSSDGLNWNAPVWLADSSHRDDVAGVFPRIATDGSGQWIIAYSAFAPTTGDSIVVHYSTNNGASFGPPTILDSGTLAWSLDVESDRTGGWLIAYNYNQNGTTYPPDCGPAEDNVYIKAQRLKAPLVTSGTWTPLPSLIQTYAATGKDLLPRIIYPRIAGGQGEFFVAFRSNACSGSFVNVFTVNSNSGATSGVQSVFATDGSSVLGFSDVDIHVGRASNPDVSLLVNASTPGGQELILKKKSVSSVSWSLPQKVAEFSSPNTYSRATLVSSTPLSSYLGVNFMTRAPQGSFFDLHYSPSGPGFYKQLTGPDPYSIVTNGAASEVPRFYPNGLPNQQVPVVNSLQVNIDGIVTNAIQCYATTSSWKRTDHSLTSACVHSNVALWYRREVENSANCISFALTPRIAATGVNQPVHYLVYKFEDAPLPPHEPASYRYYYSLPNIAPAQRWTYISRNLLRDLEQAKGLPSGTYTMHRLWNAWFYQTGTIYLDDIRNFPE